MAAISRVAVPAVSFQLGGMVAAAALDFAEGHPSNRGGGGGDDMPLPKGRGAPGEKGQSFGGQRGARDEWTFVDTLDTGLSGKCPDEHALWTDGSCNDRVQSESYGTNKGESTHVRSNRGRLNNSICLFRYFG